MTAEWMDRALCVGADPEVWFDARRRAEAQRVCGMCPVAEKCRTAWPDAYRGVWGGEVHMSKNAGNDVADYLREHGTEQGYKQHLKDGTPACGNCLVAHMFSVREYRERSPRIRDKEHDRYLRRKRRMEGAA
jgi:WhiB family redox-sensing transcriptional regulator